MRLRLGLPSNPVKLRFKVNQAECFRRGINCDKSIAVIEVNPSELPQPDRDAIADHLNGIDVIVIGGPLDGDLVQANEPNIKELLLAIRSLGNEKTI